MKNRYTEDELVQLMSDTEFALSMLRQMKAQHPSAKAVYELDSKRVSISYPLPKDFDPKRTQRFLNEVTFKDLP